MPVRTTAPPVEPTDADLQRVIGDLEKSWAATVTVRRKSKEDVGYRDVYVSVDNLEPAILHAGDEVSWDVPPGAHRLKAHNTLFRKKIDVNLSPGEHATFRVVNRAGFGTYSVLAFFLGGGPLYLTFERDTGDARG
jgi:hypothetical protein